MGSRTTIAWTEATWNPWRGCHKVSEGCRNCYMYRLMKRWGQDPTRVERAGLRTFLSPLRWKKPRMIFTCSMSDFFIKEADEWRDEAWGIIRRTPQHTYQILTKRPERIEQCLPLDWGDGWPNVWLGVSAETHHAAIERLSILERIPAVIRFVSCEPLLSPINVGLWPWLDWVIVGGESGPGYREMDLDWARDIRDWCIAQGIPFFFKQASGPRPGLNPELDGCRWQQYPRGVRA